MASPASATSGWQTEDQCVSGKCLRFDGTNDLVNGGVRSITIGNAYTLSAWIRAASTQVASTPQIIGIDDGSADRVFQFRLNSGNLELIRFNSSNGLLDTVTVSPVVNLADNNWHHVTA